MALAVSSSGLLGEYRPFGAFLSGCVFSRVVGCFRQVVPGRVWAPESWSWTNGWFLHDQRVVPLGPTGCSSKTNGWFLLDQRVVPLGPTESSFSGLLPNLSIFRSSFILRSIPIRCYPIGVLPQSVQLHKEAGCRVLTQSSSTLEAVWNSFFSATINVCVSARAHARTRLPVQRA